MSERILFLTGKLAEKNLQRVLQELQPVSFTAETCQLGINVAGLMTADMIQRRLEPPEGVDRIIVPGRCRGDLDALGNHLGIPVRRGPDELKDLPDYFGMGAAQPDLSRYDIRIFAEIVDAPFLDIDTILARARDYQASGADIIDIGCLPDTPFPHLAESIQALHNAGFRVSVDSMNPDELIAGGLAGADYLLSLHEDTLWIADEVESVPVLIPDETGNLESVLRAIDRLSAEGRPCLADPVLDPLLLGFTESVMRYRELRKRRPDVEILMGTGNVTELTDADTCGINAVLAGIASELGIRNILTTQVSEHARRVVHELDIARRTMYLARRNNELPRNLDRRLLTIHERDPFPYNLEEIEETATAVRDPSYRVQTSADGIHVFNRDGLQTATDPFSLYPQLEFRGDTGHAFYMGAELARAQIAWQLGKRYVQDEELDWGCAADRVDDDVSTQTRHGCTMGNTGTDS
jgi:dihydropteroate synthase-like protein